MDFRVKSNGKIQAVAEDGTPLGGEFTFHYTFFRAYGEDGNTLLSKLPSKSDKKKNQLRLENVRRLMARAMEHQLPYTFHLMVPRVHDRCVTRLVPVEHADGLATKVQVCNGDILPFTTMLETKKLWHCVAKLNRGVRSGGGRHGGGTRPAAYVSGPAQCVVFLAPDGA